MNLGMLAGAEFSLDPGEAAVPIAAITSDSRQVAPATLFAALPGTRVDGAQFAGAAIKAGAAAILAHSDAAIPDADVPVLRTNNPRKALAHIAARFFPDQPGIVAAVTGTAGKTSVASFLRQIWAGAGMAAASIGTTGIDAPGYSQSGNLTTPDPVVLHRLMSELAARGVTHASMEASSHGLDQYRLDYHADQEEYFQAKMRLFGELLPPGSPAIINADDPLAGEAEAIADASGLEVLTVGRKGRFLALKRVEHERFRQIGEIQIGDAIFRIEFPLAGDFQLANGLVAATMAIATGMDAPKAIAGLERLVGAPGRLQLIGRTGKGAPIYVDYAHKPEALEQMLGSLRPFVTGSLHVVIGCGGDRDPGKRPIMGAIAARLADRVYVTDDNPRSEEPGAIRREIMAACPGGMEIGDRKQAIATAIEALKAGDVLVVAGKGHEEGQIIGQVTHPFSDRKVILELLGMMPADREAAG